MNTISAKQFLDTKATDDLVIDARSRGEFQRGHLESAINIPLEAVETLIHSAARSLDQKIYVYCLSGSRSRDVVEKLSAIGFTNVYNIENGLLALRVQGVDLVV